MISFFSNLFTCCFCGSPQGEYQTVQKKDDDRGIEEAHAWIQFHPVDTKIYEATRERIQSFADEVIQSLKNVPLTTSNIEDISMHFAKIAQESERLRCRLADKVTSLKCDKDLLLRLRFALVSACPKQP